MATYHPEDAVLFNYATGAADEATSLLVATHLALCPKCRDTVAGFEDVGGAMLDTLAPMAVSDQCRAGVMAALDLEGESIPTCGPAPVMVPQDLRVPRPLRDYLPDSVDNVPWHSLMRGLDIYDLPVASGTGSTAKTRLMRVAGGQAMPAHTHEGEELILVLTGGFSDEHGHFLRGDVAYADDDVNHQPVADPGEDCLCLVVTTAPLKLTSPIGRLANLFVRF